MTCKVFILYLTCILGCLYHPLFGQSLSGSYTIGNADGTEDYPTIAAAITALKTGTITGDVEFNMGIGTYNETMDLSAINNGTFKITFVGANKALTVIQPMGNIAVDKSGISITNMDHVVLKNFTLQMDDISDTKVPYEQNGTKGISISGSSDISLENLVLFNANFVLSQSNNEYIASAISLEEVEDVAITSCRVTGAGTLIHLQDFQNVTITDSEFSEGQVHIYHVQEANTSADALTIDGNSFEGPFPTDRAAGAIYLNALSNVSTNLKVENNTIYLKVAGADDTIYGIHINAQNDPIISNNVINGGSTGLRILNSPNAVINSNQVYQSSSSGLHLQDGGPTDIVNNILTSGYRAGTIFFTSNVRLAHNTLYTYGSINEGLRVQAVNGDSLTVMNNLITVDNTSISDMSLNDINATNIKVDYNLYSGNSDSYTVTGFRLGGANGVSYSATSLSDWQTNQVLYDQNSQSFAPTFVGAGDLHLTEATSYRFATAIPDLTEDIDDDSRDATQGIDVGADQYVMVVPDLSGNYKIGNASGTEDYPTLAAAIAALKTGNIIGDITFGISNGTYNETMDLSGINNGAFTITFSGASKENTIIHPLGNIAADKSGISLTDMDHVVLENFTLDMADISNTQIPFGGNDTKGIHVIRSSDITVENLIIKNSNYVYNDETDLIAAAISLIDVENTAISSNQISEAGISIFLNGFQNLSITDNDFSSGKSHIDHVKTRNNAAQDLTISRNTFTGPYPKGHELATGAIYMDSNFSFFSGGSLKSSFGSGITIEDNEFDTKVTATDDGVHSLWVEGYNNVVVSGNKIHDGSTGMYIRLSTSLEVSANEIYKTSSHGMYLLAANDVEVFNNIITSSHHPVNMWTLIDVRLAHNTLSAFGTRATITTRDIDGLELTNNLFHVESTVGTEVYLNEVDNLTMDHNLFSGNANTYAIEVLKLDGGYNPVVGFASLSDWQTHQALYDQNSQSFVPTFAGADDYHLTDATSYRFGKAIADITTDIDGEDRTGGIDVGADQYINLIPDLSGHYTVGNASGTEDYPTLAAAIADLKIGNITGDVTFNITNGTYNETMDLSGINNGEFNIAFEGASKENTIIHPMGNVAADKSGISLANANNVELKNFTLEMDDISATKVDFAGNETLGINLSGASDITLENLALSNAKHVFNDDFNVYIAAALLLVEVENITIASCEISGAGTLIYLEDYSTISISDSDLSNGKSHIFEWKQGDTSSEGLTIRGNSFTGPFSPALDAIFLEANWQGGGVGGIVLNRGSNLIIEDNVFDMQAAGSGDNIHGIYITGWDGVLIHGNRIEDGSVGIRTIDVNSLEIFANQIYGATNFGCQLRDGDEVEVINNIITSSNRTFELRNISNVTFNHNTLYAYGAQSTIFAIDIGTLDLRNNIFQVENTVQTEVYIQNVSIATIDRNLFSGNAHSYTIIAANLSGNFTPFYGAASLSDWQAHQTQYDQNSQSFVPTFAGAEDYHITDATNYRFGAVLPNVTSDLDGDHRDATAGIDVGADQFCTAACVASVSPPSIVSFSPTSGPVGTQVTLLGTNFDPTPANNTVYFGATQATVVSSAENEMVVTVPYGATYEPITIFANQLAGQSLSPFQVTFESDGTLNNESFDENVSFAVGNDPRDVALGDFNQDGLVDMVSINVFGQSMSILQNTSAGIGDINFTGNVDQALPGTPSEILTADLNGDGYLDIAVGYFSTAVFSIFENMSGSSLNGTVTFGTRQDFNTSTDSHSIMASDINADGQLDLIVAERDADQVTIFGNTSDPGGTIDFSSFKSLTAGDGPRSVAVADIDQDGKQDIIVGNQNEDSFSVFLKDITSFGFAAKQDFALGNYVNNLVAGDIDGDQVPDLVMAIAFDQLEGFLDRIKYVRNNSTPGSLSFTYSEHITGVEFVNLADLDGDGFLDPMFTELFEGMGMKQNTSGSGAFGFGDEDYIDHEVDLRFLTAGDLDNDGEPDVIMPGHSFGGSFIEIARNLGSGNDFKSFSLEDEAAPATIDAVNHTITIDLNPCTELTSLIPDFELSPNATATIAALNQQSGVTANDYSSTVTYVVKAEDGATQSWTITVSSPVEVDQVVENVSACESYAFDGNELITSGQYQGMFTNIHGCDSLVTLNLSILEPTSGDDDVEACESYEWEGTLYTASGTYQEILTNAVGCDSTATLNLTILEPTSGDEDVEACESYEWEGTVYTASGTYQEILTNAVGCDSTATLNLTILEPTSGDDDVEACDSYEWEGTVYTSSGTYQEILTNAVGCDSTATLNLTILEPTSGDDDVEACDSYEWEGTVYTSSGTYQEILTNAVGCDSTATLNLTILEPTSGDDAVEACESYEWEGTVYTASGTYQEILTNAVGCDSTATLNLTILEPTSGDDDVEACESYEWEGTVYTASGTYQEILTNAVGCDSTATLNLTILEPTSGDEDVEACESYEWEGTVYTASGTYQEILTNAVGCDSTATLNLTILEPTSGEDDVEACENYEWEGTVYTVSGTYQEILTNSVGCDSTATLNLTILEPTSGDEAIEACDSYEWEGTVYTTSGTYQEILTNSVGCDSTATLNLTILEPTAGDEDVEACESYEWEGTVYMASGTYQEILTNAVGCDSTATLNLTILEPTSGDEDVEACESYEWEGTVYTASGTYHEMLTNSVGCDSTATLNLTILEPTEGSLEVEACGSYEWEGNTFTASGTYHELLTNAAGCDSTATLNLTIVESTFSYTQVEACGSYEWNDQTLTENGIHEVMLTNVAGCDSLAILDLTLLEASFGEADVFACGSYEWEGVTYETSGIYEAMLTASNGCDSLATLNLTIGQEELNEVIMDICSDYSFGSQQITASGTYQETFSNTLGCDSTVVLTAFVFETPLNGIIQEGNTLMAEDNSELLSFQWYDCSPDQMIAGEVNRAYTPVADGTYSLEVSNGVCTVQSTCFDYRREDNVLSTDPEESTVTAYPNPTTEKITISFPQVGRSDVAIYGLDGRLIVEADVSGQKRFEYALPEPGMYLIKVSSSSGQQEFIKVLRK